MRNHPGAGRSARYVSRMSPSQDHVQDHARAHIWPGVPLALTSAVLFGLATPLAKLLLGAMDAQMLAGLMYLGAGLGLGAVLLGRRATSGPATEAPLRRHDMPWLAAVVLFGGVAGPLLLMLGLARTPASTASLLLNLEGLATMGIAWLVFRESVDRRLLLGAFAILAGAVLLSWQGGEVRLGGGAGLVALACLAWGIDNNLSRNLSSADPVEVAAIKGLAAGAVNFGLALLRGGALPAWPDAGAAALVGFFGIGVSLVLFLLALRHVGTARTGAYFSLAPFVGALAAIVLLRDPLTPQLGLAGVLMGFGLWMHLAERHAHEHEHEALEHEHAHSHDDGHHDHAHPEGMVGSHSHRHRHMPMRHTHAHYPDLHHRHGHR